MNLLLPPIGKVNFELFNYGYIWPRNQIINQELQDYVTPQDNPQVFKRIVSGNSIAPIIAPADLRAKHGQMYSSAVMTTKGKLAFMYGDLSCKIKLPKARGLWPAIWLLAEYDQWPSPWPMLPEFDIMEYVGGTILHSTVHYFKDGELHKMSRSPKTEGKVEIDPNQEHEIKFHWDRNTMSVTVNGMASLVVPTPSNFRDRHAHLLINVACGGGWPKSAGYVPVQHEMGNQALTRFTVTDLMIETDNMRYAIPEGVEQLPKGTNSKGKRESTKEKQDRITSELQKPGEVDARQPKETEASTPTQPNNPHMGVQIDDTTQKLMYDLLLTGWYFAHNKDYPQEVLHHYLTGEKTQPNMDSPPFVGTKENSMIAWGGVLDILNRSSRALAGSATAGVQIDATTDRNDVAALQAKLDASTRNNDKLLGTLKTIKHDVKNLYNKTHGVIDQ